MSETLRIKNPNYKIINVLPNDFLKENPKLTRSDLKALNRIRVVVSNTIRDIKSRHWQCYDKHGPYIYPSMKLDHQVKHTMKAVQRVFFDYIDHQYYTSIIELKYYDLLIDCVIALQWELENNSKPPHLAKEIGDQCISFLFGRNNET